MTIVSHTNGISLPFAIIGRLGVKQTISQIDSHINEHKGE